MATGNSCNFSLGITGQVLTMTSATTVAFASPGTATRSQSLSSRTLNTIFQPSSTRDATVSYSVDISCTLSLSGGMNGTVILEMATNAGFTTGVQTLSQFTNAQIGTLTIGLNITQTNTACLTGYIPFGNYVRIRTVTTTGTPTFTLQNGQEVLL